MSDEKAEQKKLEETEIKKKMEEVQSRLWIVQLVRDPEAGQTVIQPVQNVQKQWQLDMMLDQAKNHQEMTKLSRTVVELLKGLGVLKEPKKGLFKK